MHTVPLYASNPQQNGMIFVFREVTDISKLRDTFRKRIHCEQEIERQEWSVIRRIQGTSFKPPPPGLFLYLPQPGGGSDPTPPCYLENGWT